MSHLSVRTLIEDCVKGIDDSIDFTYGRFSDFNSRNIRQAKRVHLDTLSATADYTEESYNLTWNYPIGITFYELDDIQGAEKETADILDKTDIQSTKFLQALNLKTVNQDVDIGILSIRKDAVIKVTKDAASGHTLQFNLVVPDDFNYCIDD